MTGTELSYPIPREDRPQPGRGVRLAPDVNGRGVGPEHHREAAVLGTQAVVGLLRVEEVRLVPGSHAPQALRTDEHRGTRCPCGPVWTGVRLRIHDHFAEGWEPAREVTAEDGFAECAQHGRLATERMLKASRLMGQQGNCDTHTGNLQRLQ